MNAPIKHILAAVLGLFIAAGTCSGAETQVSISASNNIAFIGDKINLKILVKTTHPGVQDIEAQAEKKEFEILVEYPTEKRQQPTDTVFEKNVTIAFFKVGNFEIGPFTLRLIKDGQILESKTTNSVPVAIKSVLKEEDKDIKPLKPLIDLKGNPWYSLKFVLLGLLLAAAILFFFWWNKKRKTALPTPPKTPLSPLEELESRLKELADKKLAEKGKLKLHFIELTQVIKHFLHRQYGLNAEDFTTEETLYFMKTCENERLILDNLRFVFNTADLVKFAKFIPDPPVLRETDEKMKEIVVRYKLRVTQAVNPTGPNKEIAR